MFCRIFGSYVGYNWDDAWFVVVSDVYGGFQKCRLKQVTFFVFVGGSFQLYLKKVCILWWCEGYIIELFGLTLCAWAMGGGGGGGWFEKYWPVFGGPLFVHLL